MSHTNWYEVLDTSNLISPSLLVYPHRIEKNIEQMIAMVDDVDLLQPHIKTHKTAEIVQMQLRYGIKKFKCATIAEAELLALSGATEILYAMPLVGTNIARFVKLIKTYPNAAFSTLVDNNTSLRQIAAVAAEENIIISLWMDINVGMHRTGISPNDKAISLFCEIENLPNIEAKGFHVYDGHIHHTDFDRQKHAVDTAFASVVKLKEQLEQQEITVKNIIAGGSPSFPVHVQRKNVRVAPGTTLLWDAQYEDFFSYMQFQTAAVLLTRIISKPAPNTLCFDLGHKSIAPEMNFPRVRFLNLPDSEQISQSEEHLVVKVKDDTLYQVGDCFYAIPRHICPTVAKYETLKVVENGKVTAEWEVAARNQQINI